VQLDRFVRRNTPYSQRAVKQLIAAGGVRVNGEAVKDPLVMISRFCHVEAEGIVLQQNSARYYMLNKPAGYLSATSDPDHTTVMELLGDNAAGLHIAGRLDRQSTGLLVLTNDGQWSRKLTQPDEKMPKVYQVETGNPIDPLATERFSQGIYFAYEDITTSPAQLQQLSSHKARLTIYEGRYHQIKRMFGVFRNPVVSLHRESMGNIVLDPTLKVGEYRALEDKEIQWVNSWSHKEPQNEMACDTDSGDNNRL